MNLTGKRVLVTGGAGFIGSHLCRELAKGGNRIVILDDLSTGKKENIESILGERVIFIQGSVVELPLLRELFQNIDTVYHLAALASVPQSLDNPLATHEVNLTGTLNVLLAARDIGVRKVVYSSSSAIYGDSPVSPKVENMPPDPQSPYAVTKLAGEYYCSVFGQAYDMSVVSLRYFNVYGPGQNANSTYAAVIPAFVTRILEDKPPVIYGDGEQTRDLVFVADVVAANLTAAASKISGVFNVGTGNAITINALAELVTTLVKKDFKPVYEEPRPGDIIHSTADITRARKALGWQPRVTLEEGLQQYIRWAEQGNNP